MCKSEQAFIERRKLWIECLSGNDRNSISRQIAEMLWHAAAFEIVNEARRMAPPVSGPEAAPGAVQLNGMVHDLIDSAFFISQQVAVRRLLDGNGIADPKRGVYSIVALIKDMEKYLSYMTRKNIFHAENLPYDCVAMRREYERVRDQKRATQAAYFLPRDLDPWRCEYRHRQLDWFAGVLPNARSEDDQMRGDVFDALRENVETAGQTIKESVNKFIAHAATPESRAAVRADAVTFGELRGAYRTICEVTNFLSVDVLGGPSLGSLPIPQFDQFEHLDRPLAKRDAIPELRGIWDDFERETHAWGLWHPEGFPDPWG